MRAIKKFQRDERGVVVVMIGAVLALLIVFSVYAIDAPQMLLVRTQLQNAADAGCLAGAIVGGLTSDTAAARAVALLATGANEALIDSGGDNIMDAVEIDDTDVTFTGNRICVQTHRTEATGDEFLNYFMRVFSPTGTVGEMTARACAEFAWVCGGKCIEPWAPPDRWCDSAGTGDCLNGNESYEPELGEFYDPITTGYTDSDLGDPITLVLANGNHEDFGSFWYYSIDLPPINKGDPISGGDQYKDWMCEGCLDTSFTVEPGDWVNVEPGKKTGPNDKGLTCIIESDPTAEWDDVTGTVINSAFPVSPRIVKAVLFDPTLGLQTEGTSGRKYLTVVKVFVVFVEGSSGGNQIHGRFMRLSEPGGTVCVSQTEPSFLYKTRLVE